MVTIKSYTDISQSKKLAEILPLESADMLWEQHGAEPYVTIKPWTTIGKSIGCHCLSCWSLAALFSVLPNKIVSHETAFEGEDAEGINDIYYKRIESTEDGRYMCRYSGNGYKYRYVADNPVDACYEMIIRLNELNLL